MLNWFCAFLVLLGFSAHGQETLENRVLELLRDRMEQRSSQIFSKQKYMESISSGSREELGENKERLQRQWRNREIQRSLNIERQANIWETEEDYLNGVPKDPKSVSILLMNPEFASVYGEELEKVSDLLGVPRENRVSMSIGGEDWNPEEGLKGYIDFPKFRAALDGVLSNTQGGKPTVNIFVSEFPTSDVPDARDLYIRSVMEMTQRAVVSSSSVHTLNIVHFGRGFTPEDYRSIFESREGCEYYLYSTTYSLFDAVASHFVGSILREDRNDTSLLDFYLNQRLLDRVNQWSRKRRYQGNENPGLAYWSSEEVEVPEQVQMKDRADYFRLYNSVFRAFPGASTGSHVWSERTVSIVFTVDLLSSLLAGNRRSYVSYDFLDRYVQYPELRGSIARVLNAIEYQDVETLVSEASLLFTFDEEAPVVREALTYGILDDRPLALSDEILQSALPNNPGYTETPITELRSHWREIAGVSDYFLRLSIQGGIELEEVEQSLAIELLLSRIEVLGDEDWNSHRAQSVIDNAVGVMIADTRRYYESEKFDSKPDVGFNRAGEVVPVASQVFAALRTRLNELGTALELRNSVTHLEIRNYTKIQHAIFEAMNKIFIYPAVKKGKISFIE